MNLNLSSSTNMHDVRNFWLIESGISEIFACGIRNSTQGIQNPTILTLGIQNLSSTDKGWNPVSGIRNPRRGIQNLRLSWVTLHRAISLLDDM